MKLFKDKEHGMFLSRTEWTKIFLACSVMIIVLYTCAMVASLCGSNYFILNFQNNRLDQIEAFMQARRIQPLISWLFSTVEFCIILSFVIKKFPKWYYPLAFYGIRVVIAFIVKLPPIVNNIYPFLFYLSIPIIELCKDKNMSFKNYLFCLLRVLIGFLLSYTLQVMIYVIKDGNWSFQNNIMSLATHFIYAIEYNIALSVILATILLIHREKGDGNLWTTYHTLGGFSQTSKKQSQKSSSTQNLTKTQKNKLRLLYVKFYLTQLGAFLLLMVLPFVLGKVLEFLVMYFSFAIVRYILGFNYSLHYKKESTCITVGAIVFGILSLAVPFFYVVLVIAIVLGISLAVTLHLSYKYKGFYLFVLVSKPDKFAELYVLFDGDLTERHVEVMCHHYKLTKMETDIVMLYCEGNKKSYIAKKLNYSEKTIERTLNESIDKIKHFE